MRYLVLTDIHANLEALEACLADAARARLRPRRSCSAISSATAPIPTPSSSACRRSTPAAIVRGNHDKVACGLEQADGFNAVAKRAAHWTLDVLTPANREWLAALPRGPDRSWTTWSRSATARRSTRTPTSSTSSTRSARSRCRSGRSASSATRTTRSTFELADDGVRHASARRRLAEPLLQLKARVEVPVNPGSVGQPRDGDPRAAYAIVDTDGDESSCSGWTTPSTTTQAKMLKAGLPDVLAQRLAVGR